MSPIFKRPNAGSMPLCLANYFIVFPLFLADCWLFWIIRTSPLESHGFSPRPGDSFALTPADVGTPRPWQAPISPDRGNDSSRNQICTESSATPARNSFRTDNPKPTLVCLEKKRVKIPENHPIPNKKMLLMSLLSLQVCCVHTIPMSLRASIA